MFEKKAKEPVLNFEITKRNFNNAHEHSFVCKGYFTQDELVSHCKINVYLAENGKISRWVISEWYTEEKYMHQGNSKKVLNRLVTYLKEQFGTPYMITYIWNQTNEYVLDFLKKNFGAVCACPIEFLKNTSSDVKEAHIYKLDVGKVFDYFNADNVN